MHSTHTSIVLVTLSLIVYVIALIGIESNEVLRPLSGFFAAIILSLWAIYFKMK